MIYEIYQLTFKNTRAPTRSETCFRFLQVSDKSWVTCHILRGIIRCIYVALQLFKIRVQHSELQYCDLSKRNWPDVWYHRPCVSTHCCAQAGNWLHRMRMVRATMYTHMVYIYVKTQQYSLCVLCVIGPMTLHNCVCGHLFANMYV